jgi:hypothetical protein
MTTDSSAPVQVAGLSGFGTLQSVAAIGTGGAHTCAVVSGEVGCWGADFFGQLGNGTTTFSPTPVPVQVVGVGGTGTLQNAAAIAAGSGHTCALVSGGNVDCWGVNGGGQLGNGDSPTPSPTPVQVLGVAGSGTLQSVSAIDTGEFYTCALIRGGNVDCWGDNTHGQLGDGKTGAGLPTADSPIPVQVLGAGGSGTLQSVAAIASGELHSCALVSGGSVDCWGANFDGQLGDGTLVDRTTPVGVMFPALASPTASISSPPNQQTFSVGQVVLTSVSCEEAPEGPGIRSCLDSNGSSSPQGRLDTSTVGAHTYTVTATSQDGLTGTASVRYVVVGPPSAAITSPASGQTYIQGTAVGTSFVCTEAANGPGIASCSDSGGHSAPAGSLDTAALGAHTYTVKASSRDGLATSVSINYIVVAPPPPSATLTVSSTSGRTDTLAVTCQGYPGQECADELALSATVRERGKTVVGLTARKRPAPPRLRTVTLSVASAAFSVPAGQRAPVQVSLNATGRRLLLRFYKLSARISASG